MDGIGNHLKDPYVNIYRPFCFAILWMMSLTLSGQPTNSVVGDVVMPPPEAAALGIYEDIPVGYSTGIPSVSVPIHTVQQGPVSLTLGLSYHAGGVRVAENSTRIGLGWSLQGLGVVSRTVLGRPDERADGYLSHGLKFEQASNNGECGGGIPSADIELIALGGLDGEADIFTFTAGNYSGKFFIDTDSTPVLVPLQDVKVSYELDGSTSHINRLKSFTITTPDGVVYKYGHLPNSEITAIEHLTVAGSFAYTSTWKLREVSSYDGKHRISINYAPERYQYTIGASYNWPDGSSAPIDHRVQGWQISSITTSGSTDVIRFVSKSEARQDLDIYPYYGHLAARALDRIEVTSGTENDPANPFFCRAYILNQSYWVDNTDKATNSPSDFRLRLDGISQQSCTGTPLSSPIPDYKFHYERKDGFGGSDNFLPHKLSPAIDHWGYYNGAENNKASQNLPPTTVTYHPMNWGSSATVSMGKSDRDSHGQYMVLGNLRKIDYPTGGSTTFDFEANTYPTFEDIRYLYPLFNKTAGTDCYADYPVSTNYSFHSEINFESIVWKSTITPAAGYCCSDGQVGYIQVSVYEGNSNTVFASLTKSSDDCGIKIDSGYLSDFTIHTSDGAWQTNVSYRFQVRATRASAKIEFSEEELIPEEINKEVGGLRIARIVRHDGRDSNNDIVKTYRYERGIPLMPNGETASSGILYNKPIYGEAYHFEEAGRCIEAQEENPQGLGFAIFKDQSVVPLGGYDGYHITYARVFEDLADGSLTEYTFRPHQPYERRGFPYKPVMYDPLAGSTIERNQLSAITATSPSQLVATYVEKPLIDLPKQLSKGSNVKALKVYGANNDALALIYQKYRTSSSRYQVGTKTTTVDGVTQSVTTFYEGNDHYAPTAETTTGSDGASITTRYQYAPDLAVTGDVNENLAGRNILTALLTTKLVDGDTVDATRLTYAEFDGIPYLESSERYEVTWNESGNRVVDGWQPLVKIHSYTNGFPDSLTNAGWKGESLKWTAAGQIEQRKYLDFKWQYDYFPNSRVVSKITDIDGQSVLYKYDALSRLREVSAREGNVKKEFAYHYGMDSDGKALNYVQHTNTFSPTEGSSLTNTKAYQYSDGLGRTIGEVKQGHTSKEGADLITAVLYDKMGRPSRQFEPFANYGGGGAWVEPGAEVGYTETQYSKDPLGRVATTQHSDWSYPTTTSYGSNETVITDPLGTVYNADELFVIEVTDGSGRKTRTYRDKLQRVVLSKLVAEEGSGEPTVETFTSYDDKARITTVFPPGTDNSSSSDNLIFRYNYDGADNVTFKKVPDSYATTISYDDRQLPIFTAGPNLPDGYTFAASVYDEYGRLVQAGFGKGEVPETMLEEVWQQDRMIKNVYGTQQTVLGKVVGGDVRLLSASGLSGDARFLSFANDYDDYGRLNTKSSNHHLDIADSLAIVTQYSYDYADNVIKTVVNRLVAEQQVETVSETAIDHAGRLTDQWHQVSIDGVVGRRTHVSRTAYTDKDQVATLKLGKFRQEWLQTVDYSYRENGWLAAINEVGQNDDDLFAMKLMYDSPTSRSRGVRQLDGNIAAIEISTKSGAYFGQGFDYDYQGRLETSLFTDFENSAHSDRYNTAYNYDVRGNMETITRSGKYGTGDNISYGTIDQLTFTPGVNTNRFSAIEDIATDGPEAGFAAYSSEQYQFDGETGNLIYDPSRKYVLAYNYLNLPNRFTYANGSQMQMLYAADGNKLAELTLNAAGDTVTRRDYINGTEYVDGILTILHHQNGIARPIDSIGAPCPEALHVSSVAPQPNVQNYGAAEVTVSAQLEPAHSYSFLGENTVTLLPGFSSGIGNSVTIDSEPCSSSKLVNYSYYIADHLGNNRVLFADLEGDGVVEEADIISEHHYYPFGMEIQGEWSLSIGDDRYRYNGKELNEELGLYDYGARWYDPAIGRWTSVDPMADKMASWSPYNYTFNNPIKLIDPDGTVPQDIIIKQSTTNGVTTIDITVTGKVINLSSTKMYSSQLEDYAKKLNKISSFDGDAGFLGALGNKQRYNVNVSFDFEVVSSIDDIDDSDHVIAIVDEIPDQPNDDAGDPEGIAAIGGHTAAVEARAMDSNAGAHELGHLLGLFHSSSPSALMYEGGAGSGRRTVNRGERALIAGGHVGPDDGERRTGDSTGRDVTTLTSQKDIRAFLWRVRAKYNKN